MSTTNFSSTIQTLLKKYNHDATQLVPMLREVQDEYRYIPIEIIALLAEELELPQVQVEGTATFYHFFSKNHRGNYTVYLNTSATAEMAGALAAEKAFEKEAGIPFGETSSDQKIGLYKTSCLGMSDQEPAAMINDRIFTRLTPAKINVLVNEMKKGTSISKIHEKLQDTHVINKVFEKGPVFFSDYTPGAALKKTMEKSSLDVIDEVKKSKLRGRGGAGFPTGQKWGFCRSTDSDTRYVFCNVDEGEPGTFKDRVLMTELPQLIFEGMTIAAYAIEAKQGFVYLRGEYDYLREHLENVLENMRAQKLLGKRILGSRFNFDIHIKMGAGAYICGEESALIESAEGKRGQPRNRPPFPVVSGYLHKPTIVNNPETYGCAAKILLHGAEWFSKLGTSESTGTKLLSISGDCERPGIYELEWGKSIREILELCGAKDTLAVQVGGPSGQCISEKQFDRKICYSDLSTGGAFTIFNKKRDLFSIVHNHMEFFTKESCGFCVPCRAGNTLLLHQLEKIMVGNGTKKDLQGIKDLGQLVRSTSRCGLGQTSPNPLLTTLENFKDLYNREVRQDVDYISQFDLNFAIAESCKVAQRTPLLEKESQD
ncbi:MAG TPA: NAD(P)H-dependent oxidoreductase subunit E [Pseudobdellovibrionaceae bacterium]|nr:NAD(P)H-dependent oxidoreductase subunit E [Pseudobdellovibrionaceae bacterium]